MGAFPHRTPNHSGGETNFGHKLYYPERGKLIMPYYVIELRDSDGNDTTVYDLLAIVGANICVG